MSLLKTVKMQAVIVLTALAITACSSTTAPSATEIKVVEKAIMPTPPAALMVAPVRPSPPKDGKTATLLEHAAEFGGAGKPKRSVARLGGQSLPQSRRLTKKPA